MLKSPSPSRASLVRHSLYKLNRIDDKQFDYRLENLFWTEDDVSVTNNTVFIKHNILKLRCNYVHL